MAPGSTALLVASNPHPRPHSPERLPNWHRGIHGWMCQFSFSQVCQLLNTLSTIFLLPVTQNRRGQLRSSFLFSLCSYFSSCDSAHHRWMRPRNTKPGTSPVVPLQWCEQALRAKKKKRKKRRALLPSFFCFLFFFFARRACRMQAGPPLDTSSGTSH